MGFKNIFKPFSEEFSPYGSAHNGITYLLRDLFVSDDAAPITSPRTCEPGPGTLTTNTPANASISGGELVKNGAAIFTGRVSGNPISRSGLAFYSRHHVPLAAASANLPLVGFSADGSNDASVILLRCTSGQLLAVYDNTVNESFLGEYYLTDTTVDVLVIARASGGCLFYVRGANYGRWRCVWVGIGNEGATLYPYIENGANDTGTIDDMLVTKISQSGDYDLAYYHAAVPNAGAEITLKPHGVLQVYWTVANAETMTIIIKKIDANNYAYVACDQAAGTIALRQVVGGVDSLVQSVAQTWTAGNTYRVVSMQHETASGTTCVTYVDVTAKHSANISIGLLHGKIASISGFAIASNFAFWQSGGDLALPKPYDYTGFRWFMGYGDSKTAARKYQGRLSYLVEQSTGSRWCYDNIARSGHTVASMAALVASDVSFYGKYANPEIILCGLGTNDLSSLPAEEVWKANYRTIIETLHAQWPSAKIYLSKPVMLSGVPPSSPVAATATMHGYIDDLTAEYTYVYPGMDETDLDGGDSYVTYFADALHPNDAGYKQTAVLYQAAIGL